MNDEKINTDVTTLDIYQRLIKLEAEVQDLREDTKGVLNAFSAASGAFVALEWIAKIAKPVIYIVGLVGAGYMWFKGIKV